MNHVAKIAIQLEHQKEWLASVVDEEIIQLNVKSLLGDEAYSYLLADIVKISGRTQPDAQWRYARAKYNHLEAGGWWCSGIDVLTGIDSTWGCFKPKTPRTDSNDKTIKYEHPPKTETEIFALKVPPHIWRLIASRYNAVLPLDYETREHGAFWRWVIDTNIPLIVTEGAKKAGALLSAGYAAIAIPGIFSGYRQPKDEDDVAHGAPHLIPQLKIFAQTTREKGKQGEQREQGEQGEKQRVTGVRGAKPSSASPASPAPPAREIYLCFDQDSKRKTIRHVNQAIEKTGKLFKSYGCGVKIITWSNAMAKGVDDLIAACGQETFDRFYDLALEFESWRALQLRALTYNPDLILNQRRLGEFLPPPDAQLICLRSPKGTGKTHWFTWFTDPVIRNGERRVLLITHRVQLGVQSTLRLGLPFLSRVRESEVGSIFGMGLCIDSLHPKSQARFNPEEWKGCWVVLDEIQQLIWHLLNSTTCEKERVAIIKNFKQLLINAVRYGGKILIADADLNDAAIDFIRSFIGYDIQPWILDNEYKFEQSWKIHHFNTHNPAALIEQLRVHLDKGEKHLACLSAQKPKSKWGSQNIYAYFSRIMPNLKILRIDSESVADPNHPAYGCVGDLNEILSTNEYDLVLTTPVVETGVSIDVNVFDGVWGLFQGVQTADSVRQHLSRYRLPVDRYIWVSTIGINRVGSGATTVKGLLAGEYRQDKANVTRLLEAGFEETYSNNFEPICINTWAKMGCIINLGMRSYKEQIIDDLKAEGHTIVDASEVVLPEQIKTLSQEIDLTKNEGYQVHCSNVSAAQSITAEKYEKLSKQADKTHIERLEYAKGRLERLYAVPVFPELVRLDDDGWYSKIRLHYYFGVGRQFLSQREQNLMIHALSHGFGDYFIPDINSHFLGNKIAFLDWIGFGRLLEDDVYHDLHPVIQDIFTKCKNNLYALKLCMGLDVSKEKSPISLCQRLLRTIGYRLPYLRRTGCDGDRVRVYAQAAARFFVDDQGKLVLSADGQAQPLTDGRDEIFAAWMLRDQGSSDSQKGSARDDFPDSRRG